MTIRVHPQPLSTLDAPAAQRAANADQLLQGRRLTHVGRYTLREQLGEGAYGGVYEAWDPLLSRTVAVRTWQFGLKMSARIAMDRLLLAAARRAHELRHKHLVEVHDAGLSAHGIYMTMELLRGRPLREVMTDGPATSLGDMLLLARRVADALSALHGHGQVHGAVEPRHIFVTRNGRPKLLNACIASSLVHAQSSHLAGVELRDPQYLSPEFWAAGHQDAASDLYSLGVVLGEWLGGQAVFRAESPDALRRAIVTGRRPHLAELRPDLPRPVVELVERLVSVDRDRRPASAHQLALSLRRLHLQFQSWTPSRSTELSLARTFRLNWALRWPFQASML
jgi:serine/threonine-protein kinase